MPQAARLYTVPVLFYIKTSKFSGKSLLAAIHATRDK